ncbi:carboxypeptidase-like regulatory domain-containing protein [Solitalea lacus]|uniref:carboxypeptidase-like regulatory domain-containing protein n=1 Tax=Solitalea lacus TaxID=2911172 RepID=UPI001EDA74D1|nr:carboxypeptidase-like regulatory domain-containing protein [Solitalea lacus]UKJ07593.1 carboxypeptidase-like regulatory domain-containing protein [Solitalea lacus]
MRNVLFGIVMLTGISAGLFAFKAIDHAGIKGKIVPSEGAATVWAIMGADSLRAPVNGGAFEFQNVKPGNYKVIVDAIEPLKDVQVEVTVPENKMVDLGEIKLVQ